METEVIAPIHQDSKMLDKYEIKGIFYSLFPLSACNISALTWTLKKKSVKIKLGSCMSSLSLTAL